MSFLNPAAFLFLLSLPVIFLFHLLRIRRQEVAVSSTRFWSEAQRDQRASAPFRRFRMNLLFLLQVLAVLALTAALARPYRTVELHGDERTVLVVDTSASMKAADVPGGRFAAARAEALRLVAGLGPGQGAMVIAAGREARIAAPFTEDRGALRRALEGLEAQDVSGNLPAALRLARVQAAAAGTAAAIHVFTDGAFDLGGPPDVGRASLTWHPVGRLGHNVGVTALEVRKTHFGAFDYQLFMAVTNFAPDPMEFTLRIAIDQQQVWAERVALGAGVRRSFVVPFTHAGAGVLRAQVDAADDLATDNVAYAVIPEPHRLRVLLAGPGNAFLEKALEADSSVELVRRGVEAVGQEPADVVVLDGQAPPRLQPGRYLLVNVVPSGVPLQAVGRVVEPPVVDWDRGHPAMRHLDLSRVAIQEALRVRPVGQGRALAESPLTPLIYAFEEAGVRGIYVGFDLFKTDFPLRVAFPLFVSNALRWLAPSRLEDAGLQLTPGQAITLALPGGAREATARAPDGRTRRVPADRGGRIHYVDTTQVGIYTMRVGGWEGRYAVNLLDAGESSTAPRPLPAQAGGPAQAPAQRAFPRQQELWRLFGLLALLLLAAEALVYHRQAAGRWPLPAAALRGVVVLLVLAGLAGLTWARSVDQLQAFFVVDASDSVSLDNRARAQRLVREAARGMGRDDTAGLIVFGGEPNLDAPLGRGPVPDRLPETAAPRATDIGAAIRMALASLPEEGARRIVLLTDGNETRGSAAAAAQEARDEGVEIYPFPLRNEAGGEVLLERLVLPQEVKEGESFIARVAAWSARETEGRLSLYRDGTFVGAQAVKLKAGKNVLAYQQSLDRAGFHVYQARLEAPGDVIAENNRAVGVVAVRGRPQVLYVEKDRDQGRHLAAALRAQNLVVEQAGPEALPTRLDPLLKYDSLILSNVSALRMNREQMELIRTYVRDHGGGLVMLGGEESFGVGGFYRTPIEEALPVTMEARQKVEIPSLAAVLVIDRSGSMDTAVGRFTRLDLAKEAAQLVVELLDERNEVGVLAFDTAFNWVVPMGPAQDKDAIIREIAAIKAGGGTDMFPALKESYQALFDRQALLKHVIILSDGESSAADFPGLVRRMARDKITVSSVAIGSDAGVQLMTELSRWGKGRFYFTEDIYSIPRIFTLETQLASKAALIEQPFRPLLTPVGHEILSEIDWGTVPPLGGYVATTPKPMSETLLVSHQRDPILSVWRYGLGRTAAYTSDFKAKWGVLWLRWDGLNKFVGQLVRWTLRTTNRGDVLTTVAQRDAQGQILVEAVDQKGEFVNFLDAEAGVVFPDKRQQVLPLEQVGPGRYRAAFEAGAEGAYLVGVAQRKDRRVVGSELGSLVVPYSPEHRQLQANEGLLHEVAAITGGAVMENPAQAFSLNRRRGAARAPAWPWLFAAALLLFLPDVALRRLRLAGWLGRAVGRGRTGAGPGGGTAPRGPTGESVRVTRGGGRRPAT
jgi:Mg-chelatase subunit ChlD